MHDELVGKRVGPYEILAEIGAGGMGFVYRAHEPSLNRTIALKVLPARLARDDEFLKRFFREAQSAARISHPNVVHIYSLGSEGRLHYIAMEFVNGRDLDAVLRERGRLETVEALEIARATASALQAAHDLGVVHRDVKPHNIMIDASGRPKVMDFGIAKIKVETSALTRDGSVLGTPAYMSPEQARGEPVDGRSDVFSLGMVLFQALAGRPPYVAENSLVVMRKIVDEPMPSILQFRPDLPEAVLPVLDRALAKNPDERFATAADLEEAIAEVLLSGALGPTAVRKALTSRPTPPMGVALAEPAPVPTPPANPSGGTEPAPDEAPTRIVSEARDPAPAAMPPRPGPTPPPLPPELATPETGSAASPDGPRRDEAEAPPGEKSRGGFRDFLGANRREWRDGLARAVVLAIAMSGGTRLGFHLLFGWLWGRFADPRIARGLGFAADSWKRDLALGALHGAVAFPLQLHATGAALAGLLPAGAAIGLAAGAAGRLARRLLFERVRASSDGGPKGGR